MDGDEGVGVRIARIVDRHQLIEAQLRHGGERVGFGGGDGEIAAAQVEHEDRVARPVHAGDRTSGEPGGACFHENWPVVHAWFGHHLGRWVKLAPRPTGRPFARRR